MRTVFPPLLVFLALAVTAFSGAREGRPEEGKKGRGPELVCVNDFIPTLKVELPYATESNFMKRRFYPNHRAYLLKGVAERLAGAQEELRREGLGLKLWDGYRPLSVQREFWKALPDSRYVANPARGSRHNRGAAVDVTLVDAGGKELPMPTAFDDFTPKAAARAANVTPERAANRRKLQEVMTRHGFQVLESEWWHFDAAGWEKCPVLDIPAAEVEAAAAAGAKNGARKP